MAVAIFSLFVNILYLASPIYMLQVYDRVVPSRSTSTLLFLTLMVVVALAALSSLDLVRAQIMSRLSGRLDQVLSSAVLALSFQRADDAAKPTLLRDLDALRQFIASPPLLALFDLPFVPIYLLVAFLLHPWLGFFTLGCCLLLALLALVNELRLAQPLRDSRAAAVRSQAFADMATRNVEAVIAMGMLDGVLRRWSEDRLVHRVTQSTASERLLGAAGLAKYLRLVMQSLVLGLGAYLAVMQQVNAGAIFAGSFLLGRALQPLEQLIGGWRNAIVARASYLKLVKALNAADSGSKKLGLPRLEGNLGVENLHVTVPGGTKFLLRAVSFKLKAGEVLGVVGPSGAGKSSLAKALVGVSMPAAGLVRLDGADLQALPRHERGAVLGYLPQDVELFADTVAANISRFRTGVDEEVVLAAQLAGVHEMILRLPQGYNTQIGEGGAVLSGGYRQRIALARAVFGNPSFVVLDEPSSNLDGDGDIALARCLAQLRQRRCTVVLVSHRPTTLSSADHILLLREGKVEAFGPRDEIAAKLIEHRERSPRMIGDANG
ncbi:type I secretion system permease/ATPase [Shinella zoogloeoides]|uniref:Type I secretion system permease/ATPase n=1 Tax=Shinella zoogloeoides TaxID=352475 RepID=A0A6N8THJ4_SHIZO|nr:type I secretion system permease/ATPase [Shinella zoogloeoides]